MFNDSDNSEAQSETAAAAADGKSAAAVRTSKSAPLDKFYSSKKWKQETNLHLITSCGVETL